MRLVSHAARYGGAGVAVLAAWSLLSLAEQSQPEVRVEYHLTFPEPEHRWLNVEAVFSGLGNLPVQLQMSSASPGRYARHEFAKNIYAVEIFDSQNRAMKFTRPRADQWLVPQHDGTIRVKYRIFGDRLDGTYLAVDSTHAHVNMPATLMWIPGLHDRPVKITFKQPPGGDWQVATQLFPTNDPLVFTAPNLQYLMDSPVEFSDFAARTFVVENPATPRTGPNFRVVVHHDGSAASVDAFAAAVERIVRETVMIFGEFPSFEGDTYTFIADYLPYARGDAMEHRNSTILTAPAQLDRPNQRTQLLGSVAHEFFHAWNAERIRPKSLTPFDFTDANVSGALWFAEGFTNYYGALVTVRSGLTGLDNIVERFSSVINTVLVSPGRRLNTVVEMSQLAPFTDAASAIDRTNWGNTFISYYTWGEAIALGLDLTLRIRSDNQVTLDHYMRAMWQRFGRPAAGAVPGLVSTPYALTDARDVLGDIAGSVSFAKNFFSRFIEGHELVDYAPALSAAGIHLRHQSPGRAWLGEVSFASGLRVSSATAYGSPLYQAGVDREDILEFVDNQPVATVADVNAILGTKRPGQSVDIRFSRRGRQVEGTLTFAARPHIELRTVESMGETLTFQQRAFRAAWLGSKQSR